MKNPQSVYEVAVIENGKIIKIYPQSEYNQFIIDSYKASGTNYVGGGVSSEIAKIERANQTTADTLNAMAQSFQNTAQQAKIQNEQAIAQVNQTLNHGTSQVNSMFYNVATLFIVLTLVFVFTKVLMGGKSKKKIE